MDNSLFIGSIPPGGGSGSFSRGYNAPSLDNEDAYSPRPFDIPPQRPHYRDLDPVPHDLRYDYGGQMSYFPDGGVGIGTRNYRNSLMSEPEGWTRSHSLSRNMNFVDTYDMDPARPYGYSALRPQAPTHSSQLSLNEMGLRRDYESMPDFTYSGKLSPHNLPTRDHYADEYEGGGGGYLGRPGMVENHSYMGSLGLLDTYTGLILPYLGKAFSVFLMRQSMLGVNDAYLESAFLDGASLYRVFWKIMLPMVTPTLATLTLISFMGSWNSYLWPLIVLTSTDKQTLQVVMGNMKGMYKNNEHVLMAGAVLTILPILAVYLATQRYVDQGISLGGLK